MSNKERLLPEITWSYVPPESSNFPSLQVLVKIRKNSSVFSAGNLKSRYSLCKVLLAKKSEIPRGADLAHEKLKKYPILNRIKRDLDSYFLRGKLLHQNVWNDYLLVSEFNTQFRKKVALATIQIPSGQTRSYGQLGKKIDSRAYQAIGTSLKCNPFPLFVPCHRVVGKSGLGGFMGKNSTKDWELKLKCALLSFEKNIGDH